MTTAGEVPKFDAGEAREALEGDVERHAAIAGQAYETTLLAGNTMTSIVHHPEVKVGWYADEDDPDVSYTIAVGTAPGWRHTTLLQRTAIEGTDRPLEGPIAYLVHDDTHNTVLFRNADRSVEIEAHSGVVEPTEFHHAGIPSTALESFRHHGPEKLAHIEKAVALVHQGEQKALERQKQLAALSYPVEI